MADEIVRLSNLNWLRSSLNLERPSGFCVVSLLERARARGNLVKGVPDSATTVPSTWVEQVTIMCYVAWSSCAGARGACSSLDERCEMGWAMREPWADQDQ